MKQKRLALALAIGALALFGLVACSSGGDDAPQAPAVNEAPKAKGVTFSPERITESLAKGVTKNVAFTLPPGNYTGMTWKFNGNGHILSINPSILGDSSSEELEVMMTIVIPPDYSEDSVGGTVQLRNGKKNISKNPLKIEIAVNDTGIAGGGATGNSDIWDRELAYIETTHADSAKVREALKQSARAMQAMVLEADDPVMSIENVDAQIAALDCLYYVGEVNGIDDVDAVNRIDSDLEIDFLSGNTNEVNAARSRAYALANSHTPPGPGNSPQTLEQYKAYCSFNPDELSN